mmetsp:Transcript_71610/g.210280  ORF Transcript_71610/g.210280 Transcript_71610/m.210280 type:complete len:291 (+) Transcript_71610:722-1594(+)
MPWGQRRMSCSSVARRRRSSVKRKMIPSRSFATSRRRFPSAAFSSICFATPSMTPSIFRCSSSWRSNSASSSRCCSVSCLIMSSLGCRDEVTSRRRKSSTLLNFFSVFTFALCPPIASSFSRSIASRSWRSCFMPFTSACRRSTSPLRAFFSSKWRSLSRPRRSRSFSVMPRPRSRVSCSFLSFCSTARCCSRRASFFFRSSAASSSCSMHSWSSMVLKRCCENLTRSFSFWISAAFSAILCSCSAFWRRLWFSSCCCASARMPSSLSAIRSRSVSSDPKRSASRRNFLS